MSYTASPLITDRLALRRGRAATSYAAQGGAPKCRARRTISLSNNVWEWASETWPIRSALSCLLYTSPSPRD
eukprot:13290654-Alexandrium_andersonii.AAC.1